MRFTAYVKWRNGFHAIPWVGVELKPAENNFEIIFNRNSIGTPGAKGLCIKLE
jgi:hypothetical protein